MKYSMFCIRIANNLTFPTMPHRKTACACTSDTMSCWLWSSNMHQPLTKSIIKIQSTCNRWSAHSWYNISVNACHARYRTTMSSFFLLYLIWLFRLADNNKVEQLCRVAGYSRNNVWEIFGTTVWCKEKARGLPAKTGLYSRLVQSNQRIVRGPG